MAAVNSHNRNLIIAAQQRRLHVAVTLRKWFLSNIFGLLINNKSEFSSSVFSIIWQKADTEDRGQTDRVIILTNPNANRNHELAMAYNPRRATLMIRPIYVQNMNVKGQLFQKLEWKQTDGQTWPIAILCPLMRFAKKYRNQQLAVPFLWKWSPETADWENAAMSTIDRYNITVKFSVWIWCESACGVISYL